jgi:hypothetical protein
MTTFTNIQRNCNNCRFNGGRKLHMLDKLGACETVSGGRVLWVLGASLFHTVSPYRSLQVARSMFFHMKICENPSVFCASGNKSPGQPPVPGLCYAASSYPKVSVKVSVNWVRTQPKPTGNARLFLLISLVLVGWCCFL